jgi:hypothetical protein
MTKPGHWTTANARVIWSDEMSFTHFPTSERVYVWRTPKEAYNQECLVPTVKHGGSSVGPIITLHGRITAREYVDRLGNQVHPMIQTLFPNNEAVFQDDSAPFTQLELFGHGLNSMKVYFSIFPGQNNHHI